MSQFSHRDHYSFASLDAPRDAYLHDLLDDGLVCADLGALQSADALADPGDESELSTFAHGVPHCDSDEAKETRVIFGERQETFCESIKKTRPLPV